MSNLSVRKMRIFLAAVEEGSFTRASVRENISQPAATIVINEIEETVGTHLFLRRGNVRQAKVTEAGRLVTETFARVISVYDSETSSIKSIAGGAREANRVLLQRGFSDYLSGSWIMSLREALPSCQVSFETMERDQIVSAIQGRDATIGLIDGISDDDRCESIRLGSYKLVLATPASQATEIAPTLKEWKQVPSDCMIFGDMNPRLARRLKRQMAAAGLAQDHMTLVSDVSTIAQIMHAAGSSVVIPDVLVPALDRVCKCRSAALPGQELEEEIGFVAPFGILARTGLPRCFEQETPELPKSA